MKILIAGYYGFGNLGDELILSCILSQLRDRYKTPGVCVLSSNPTETSCTHRVSAVSRWNPFVVLYQLWKADFVVVGGGGLLQNQTSQRSLLYYLGIVGLARLLGAPVVLYALGVESLNGERVKRIVSWLFRSPLVTITVRDEASARILIEAGIPVQKIHVTADPVFSKTLDASPNARYVSHLPSVLLIPRFPCPPAGRTVFAILGRILKDQKKMNVRGLLFQPQMETPFLSSFNGEAILSEQDFLSGLTWDEMVSEVPKFDWVISARFHGLVLAALVGRPFIGVGDENKVGRLCHLLHMPFLPWNADEREIHEALYRVSLKSSTAFDEPVTRLRNSARQTAEFIR